MKNKIYILLIFILVLSLVGCEKRGTIRIGVVGTMTGTQSDLSVSGRRGIEIAVDEINRNGGIDGRQVEIVVKDDQNNPERAKEIVNEFIDEGISIVIGHYTSGMMLAAYDEIAKNDILYLGPTISADGLSMRNDNFIRFIASTKEQAQIITKVANDLEQKEFIVIVDDKNIGFNEMLFQNFEELLKENDGVIVEEYGYTELNDGTIEEIKNVIEQNVNADAVFIISSGNDTGIIAQKIRKQGFNLEIYSPLWSHTSDLIRVGGEYVEGVKVVSGIDCDSKTKKYLEFENEFIEKYGLEVTFSSVYSYETFMALAEAMNAADSHDPEKIKAQIIEIGCFEGLQQDFLIDKYGDNTRQYMMDEIVNGEYVRIE